MVAPVAHNLIDLDEFVAVLKFLFAFSEDGDTGNGWANFSDPSHWLIYTLAAVPFGVLGLTAAYRKVTGTWDNYAQITKRIQDVKAAINGGHNHLETYLRTLLYSKFIRFIMVFFQEL